MPGTRGFGGTFGATEWYWRFWSDARAILLGLYGDDLNIFGGDRSYPIVLRG